MTTMSLNNNNILHSPVLFINSAIGLIINKIVRHTLNDIHKHKCNVDYCMLLF